MPCATVHTMRSRKQLAIWVDPATHGRFRAVAAERGTTLSGLLGDLVDEVLDAEGETVEAPAAGLDPRRQRLSIRLQPGDVVAVARRAASRRTKPATYIAALVRSHLLVDPPLPQAELAALERAVAEVSAVGRNLNQIARAINSGAPVSPSTVSIIGRSIEAVEAVREAAKAYVRSAVASWEAPLG